jgi:hypothetical protein
VKWTVVKNSENSSVIIIGYSYITDECDGIIEYNKSNETFSVIKRANGCDDFDTKRLFQFLFGLIEDEKLSEKKYNIVIG